MPMTVESAGVEEVLDCDFPAPIPSSDDDSDSVVDGDAMLDGFSGFIGVDVAEEELAVTTDRGFSGRVLSDAEPETDGDVKNDDSELSSVSCIPRFFLIWSGLLITLIAEVYVVSTSDGRNSDT